MSGSVNIGESNPWFCDDIAENKGSFTRFNSDGEIVCQ